MQYHDDVDMGYIMGKTAIVDNLVNTIISVPIINKRGFNVNFTSNMRCTITDNNGIILLNTPIIQEDNLYLLIFDSS